MYIQKEKYMKVLFCTDGSKISYNALSNFSRWAKDAIIDVICVIDWSFLPENVRVEASGFSNTCANIADDILLYAKNEIENLGMLCGETFKYCGSAVESILEQSEKEDYDVILLGSHGKKGIQKWLGSVSREIAYGERLTTYISKQENSGANILFATDGTDSANLAITKVLENLNLENKQIFLCTVNETADMLFLNGNLDSNWIMSIEEKQQKFSSEALKELKERFKHRGFMTAEEVVLSGNPAQKILDYASAKNIDLIVTGSRGKSKMQDFLLGSVSKKILENAKCDVLIVKDSIKHNDKT